MASFSEEDGILRIPAASPCRRDYQLRRSSPPQTSDCDSSRPQSPWLPRSQLQQQQQQSEEPMSPLRLYESSALAAAPIDRPISRSGPLPSAASRSYSYGSPLPSPSPLPSYFSGAAGPGVLTSPKGYRQSSSFVGRLPSSSSESNDDRAVEEAAPCLRNTRFSPSPTNLRRRNCVSGELGRNFKMLQALSQVRKCKSGEIVGLEPRADVIFPIPESRKEETKRDLVRKHRPSGYVLWEALNDADSESPRRGLASAIVPIPFKWEETSAGKVRASQTQTSEKTISATKAVATTSPDVRASAVPFNWEVAPGKPKLEEKASISSAPALQLPPRLASAASLKRNSWALSPQPSRARSLSASVSAPVVKQQHSHRMSEELPLTPRAARPRGFSAQFGTPQYQSAEYSLCEDSSNRARSPTSTLCGPGTPSSSSSNSSSRKPSVSFSQSAESFDPWSYGDHASSTSRHSYADSQVEDSSVRRHDEGDPMVDTIVKLRRKLKLKSAKPPRNPVQAAPSRHGYTFQGDEFFDCQAHASSPSPSPSQSRAQNRAPSDTEEVEPPTRLPYKMPPSPARDVEPPSPTRAAPDFANCLALPRFLSKGDSSPCYWVENPSWNAPSDAPTRPAARPTLEDGYRSPAYKATLDLFSPSPELMSKKSMKLRNPSLRRRHPHLVEVLCNSLKQSLLRCTKRSVSRTHSIALYDDQITKRHQSFMR